MLQLHHNIAKVKFIFALLNKKTFTQIFFKCWQQQINFCKWSFVLCILLTFYRHSNKLVILYFKHIFQLIKQPPSHAIKYNNHNADN